MGGADVCWIISLAMDRSGAVLLLLSGLFAVTSGVSLTESHSYYKQNLTKIGRGQAALIGLTYPRAPPELAAQYTWTATATHYDSSQAGRRICPNYSTYCGAPSDGSDFWDGDICKCGGSDPTCSGGYCYDCYGANECKSECPSCPQTMCGRNFKITCLDPYGKGYCKSVGAEVTMTVTNACPQYNPCNTCKGSSNPCRSDYNHIDLCDDTFNAIAYASKQPDEGIMIGVDPA